MIKTKKRKVISENLINSLVGETSIDKRLVELLCMRDIDTKDKIYEFFNADNKESVSPFVIKDMDKAVEIVKNAVSKNKRILIYGDYDCDGITAIATLKKYFDSINYEVNYYLPDRDLEGYGLSETSINNFIDLFNPELVITVDCGVSNYNEVKLLNKMGVEVLVTDHHEPPEILPETTVINPKLTDNPLKNLAGVGVSYKLVEGLSNASIAENYLDVVAIGTIADLVPLTGENRRIVKKGLSLINQNRIKGLELLNRKTKKINHVKEGDIAFTIAPMINSMGRMANANKVVELFTSTDTFFLNNLITKLEKLNAERKFACEEIFNEALKMLSTYDFAKHKVIVLANKRWKAGVLGIVASKIVEQYNLPTILFGDAGDKLKGSARSVAGLDLYKMLSEFSANYLSFGGHSSAAGLSIRYDYLDGLREDLSGYIIKNNLVSVVMPTLTYDLEIDGVSKELYNLTETLSPFGMGNPTPKYLVKNNEKFDVFAVKHIKSATNNNEIIAFNKVNDIQNYNNPSIMTVKIGENTFNGVTRYQGIVEENYLLGKVNNDIEYLLDYFKNLLYKEKPLKIQQVEDYAKILDEVDDIFSTLIVTYSPKTFNMLCGVVLNLPKYSKKFFASDVKNRSNIAPFNSVVLSPSRNYDFSGYKNIIFVDTPINMVYYNNIDINSNIYVVKDNVPFKEETNKVRLSKDLLDELFETFKEAKKDKLIGSDIPSWYRIIENAYQLGLTEIEFSLAFYIYYELGKINIGDKFALTLSGEHKDYGKSKIYNEILKMKEE